MSRILCQDGTKSPSPRASCLPRALSVPVAAGTCHLLIVDDDPDVREMTGELLVELGYECTLCGDAAAALAVLRAEPGRFGALLADFAMPGMNGIDLIKTARRNQPHLPALLVTGYAEHRAAAAFGAENILAKPFTLAALAQRVLDLVGPPAKTPVATSC